MFEKTRYTSDGASRSIPERVAERAATRYEVDPETGCWISTYSTASHGYAQIGWHDEGRAYMTTAHRAAWTYHNGPIPDGMTVDHRCHRRPCVRPECLQILTNTENASGGGRSRTGSPTGRVCANGGHPILRSPRGDTYCLTCKNAASVRRNDERRAADAHS